MPRQQPWRPLGKSTIIDLAAIFGRVSEGKDYHRISERVSKLNQSAGRYGIRIEIDKGQKQLVLASSSRDQLQKFQSKLSSGNGSVQRSLALALMDAISADPGRHASNIAEYIRLQLKELPSWFSKPLQCQIGVPPNSLFVDPPYATRSAATLHGSTRTGAYGLLRSALTDSRLFHGFLIGDPGSGKTTIMRRLFDDLCRQFLDGRLPYPPLIIPSAYAKIDQGRLHWQLGRLDTFLRENAEMARSIQYLESCGRAIILLDGLDENPDLADWSRTETIEAWQTLFRNRCLISCRSRFYAQYLDGSDMRRRLGADWTTLALTDWRPGEAQRFYGHLAAAPMRPPRGTSITTRQLQTTFSHLAKLSEKAVPLGGASLHRTPLNLWFQSLFIASKGGTLPRNEYELLQFMLQETCGWQASKKGQVAPPPVMMALLGRAAWAGYASGPGRSRRFMRYEDIGPLLEAQWPALAAKKAQLTEALEAHPILECDPSNGLLWIDPHFMDFLAAWHLLQTLMLRDVPWLADQFSKPVLWDVSRFLDEGLECLTEDKRRSAAEGLMDAFRVCERSFVKDGSCSTALALNQIGYHLGRMGEPHGREFLHQVLKERSPALGSEMCYWAIIIGLALSGDVSALGAYVKRIEKRPKGFSLNMAYCQIYFLDKTLSSDSIESSLRQLSPRWEKTCDAILAQLDSKVFRNIRLLDLFSLRRFIEVLGPQPFQGEAGPRRQDFLRLVIKKLSVESSSNKALDIQLRRLYPALRDASVEIGAHSSSS